MKWNQRDVQHRKMTIAALVIVKQSLLDRRSKANKKFDVIVFESLQSAPVCSGSQQGRRSGHWTDEGTAVQSDEERAILAFLSACACGSYSLKWVLSLSKPFGRHHVQYCLLNRCSPAPVSVKQFNPLSEALCKHQWRASPRWCKPRMACW